MGDRWLTPVLTIVVTIIAMEAVAVLVHRYVMHGFGWNWHRSHHQPRSSHFEKNDLYAIVFAALSVTLFLAGSRYVVLWWVGLGMLFYGLLYGLLHDVLVHRRIPFFRLRANGYVKRLVQAHRLHHATQTKDGAVSFGFLYAPPVARLVSDMRAMRRRD